MDNVQGSVKVQIKGIAVIDLPSAHTFSSNSPTVTIACGKFTAQTEVIHVDELLVCIYIYLLNRSRNDEPRRRKRKLGSMPHGRIWTSLSSSTRSLNYGCLFHLVKLISGTVISCALKYSPPRRETKDI